MNLKYKIANATHSLQLQIK